MFSKNKQGETTSTDSASELSALSRELVDLRYELYALRMALDARRKPQMLYIVGFARSGTTVLSEILNSSGDVLILSELNSYLLAKFPDYGAKYGGSNPYEHFLNRKLGEVPVVNKGGHLPKRALADVPLSEFFATLGGNFSLVGDKFALSFKVIEGVSETSLLNDYISDHEEASYIFTLRKPEENIQSVLKMFPEIDPTEALCWLAATWAISIRAYVRLSHAYIVFHEDIDARLIKEVGERFGITCEIAEDFVSNDFKNTKIPMPEDPPAEPGTDGKDILNYCYYFMHRILSRDATILKTSRSDAFMGRISELVTLLEGYVLANAKDPYLILPTLRR